MIVDTGRFLNSFFVRLVNSMLVNSYSHLRYDNLAISFQRFNHNITTVDIQVAVGNEGPKESASLAGVLKSLANLRNISLCDISGTHISGTHISGTHKNVLPLLEFIGNRIECLRRLLHFLWKSEKT